MPDAKRVAIAKDYRKKSDAVIVEARTDLDHEQLRSVYCRSWYATMQIITAAAYLLLNDLPKANRPNWEHVYVPKLFVFITKKTQTYDKYAYLQKPIDLLRQSRENADYSTPEAHMSLADATAAYLLAEKVREIMIELMDKADGR